MGLFSHTVRIFCWNTPIKVKPRNKISANFYAPSEAAVMTIETTQIPGVMKPIRNSTALPTT